MKPSNKIPGTNLSVEAVQGSDEAQRRFTSRVAVTAAVLAAVAAIASMQSGSHLNQSMLEQIQASDQWNFYQAKGIKRGLLQSKVDTAALLEKAASPADVADLERYKKEQDEIKGVAEAHQHAATRHQGQHKLLSYAATAAQVAIALCAVALLTKRAWAWWLALLTGAAGGVLLALGMAGG